VGLCVYNKSRFNTGNSKYFAHGFCVVGPGPVVASARVLVHDVLDHGVQTVARGGARRESQVLDCGAQADARGASRCAPQVFDRVAQVVARGAARCASQVLDRGAYITDRL
jgi:hypothetical protein